MWYAPVCICEAACKPKVSHACRFLFGNLISLFGVLLASLPYEGVKPGKPTLITWPPSTQTPPHTYICTPNIQYWRMCIDWKGNSITQVRAI